MHLVVVGGGFAGIKLLRKLRYHPDIQITLLTDDRNFRYGPALYRTATGHRRSESWLSIHELTSKMHNVTVRYEAATKIDRKQRVIQTKSGARFRYDYCVIAIGVVTSYFGIKGMEDHSYTIKSERGIEKLREHLHQVLVDDQALDTNYVIVGAGPTGVELSAALRAYLKKIAKFHHIRRSKVNLELVEAAPRILPSFNKAASKKTTRHLRRLGVKIMTNKKVLAETDNSLIMGDRKLPTHTVIWTAGVSNNPFFLNNADQFTLNDRKRVVVDDHLQVDPYTFVIGDNAATPYSGLALTAVHNAGYVGKAIIRLHKKKHLRKYHPFAPISVIPVGPNWALLQWKQFVLAGPVASLMRIAADLIGYSDVMGPRRAFSMWLHRNKQEEDCTLCKPHTGI